MDNIEIYTQNKSLHDEENQAVVKANSLIQQSRFYLTAQEQKIILYLVSKIKPKDIELSLYDFDIIDFCKVCDIDYNNGANYRYIKQTIQKLRDKSMWITHDNGDEVLYAWLDSAIISKNKGTVTLKINDLMKPFLLQLASNYTQYTLYYVLAMRGQYSIKLYELLKSYQYKHRCEFELDDFKRRLGAEKYERHADFMRFVLTPALTEIENLSDIKVSYNLYKTGRKFSRIVFMIQPLTAKEEWEKRHKNINKKLNKKNTKG